VIVGAEYVPIYRLKTLYPDYRPGASSYNSLPGCILPIPADSCSGNYGLLRTTGM